MAESKDKANKQPNPRPISPPLLTTQTFNLNSCSNVNDTALQQVLTTRWASGPICHFVVLMLLRNAEPVSESPVF